MNFQVMDSDSLLASYSETLIAQECLKYVIGKIDSL